MSSRSKLIFSVISPLGFSGAGSILTKILEIKHLIYQI